MIHKDSRSAIDALVESIDILTEEIVAHKAETPHSETPTPIPFKVTENKPSRVDPISRPPPPAARLHPLTPARICSMVVTKGRKKTNYSLKIIGSSTTA